MADTIKNPNLINVIAGADLSSSQYKAVKLNGTDNTVILAGAGEIALGILQNTPTSGQMAEVAVVSGGAYYEAATTINAGNFLKSDASGNLTPVTADGDWYVAVALTDAVDGDVKSCLVQSGYHFVAA